jgi:hypothetical protein
MHFVSADFRDMNKIRQDLPIEAWNPVFDLYKSLSVILTSVSYEASVAIAGNVELITSSWIVGNPITTSKLVF